MDADFKPRLYQQLILDTASKANTLVVLPTGLGKTAIAAMLIQHRLANYPDSKILFLAPTKPLAQQHEKTLMKLLPEYKSQVTLFTGSVPPSKRMELWQQKKIIVSTPQGVENDVIGRKTPMRDVSLLIFDEAHRAVGEYAYVFLAKKYIEDANHERILALTASPGTNTEEILEVCDNLRIEEIEYRNSDDEDVKPYVQDMDIQYVQVELSEEIKRIVMFLKRCYDSKLEDAAKLGYLQGNPSNYSKTTLLSIMAGMHGKIAQGEKDYDVLKTISLIAEAMKVSHALELIETQGLRALIDYLEGLEKQATTSKVKAVQNLVRDINFRSALILARNLDAKEAEHPKLDECIRQVKQEIALNPESKIIIFAQYRDSGVKLKELLSEEGISSELFFGQAKKKDVGMSQKQQKEIIERFEKEEFRCLIATSVGEEGLDIPEVDLVIFYEPIPSAIRTVQRRGRTGRQKEGKVIMLITKGTRDEVYRWSAHHKEKRMYKHLDIVKKNLNLKKKPREEKKLTDFTEQKNTVIIKADYREKGSQVLKELLELKANINLENLNSGDYQVSDDVVIEYKRVPDFVDSIIDGRLLGQARELRRYRKPLIIIEGEEDIYSQRRMHPNAIRGMLAALTLNMGIPILMTKNARETAGLLKVIADREQDPEKKEFQMHSLKPMTDSEIQEYIISAFPGIGATLAPHLLKHFKTIKNVVNADEKELKEVELIGEKKAKRIKELIDKEYGKPQ